MQPSESNAVDLQAVFHAIAANDAARVAAVLDEYPGLIHVRNAGPEQWEEITPLHEAAKRGHLDIVRLLVDRGAEVYSNPMKTYPPVIVAAWAKQQSVVDYFLKEIPDKADGTNKLGVTANLAARMGWIDVVRAHIAADPLAVHQRGWIGDTPLHWPAHNGFADIVTLLLDAGADIEADEINCYGGKPLHWASEHEPATVRVLLARGANVNARNIKPESEFFGVTPLIMNATQSNDCGEVTELLLEAGADMHAVDAQGKTALDHAREHGLKRITAVLTAAGAG